MTDEALVSLFKTIVWAAAFVFAIYIISTSFASLIRRNLDQEERKHRREERRQRAASVRSHRNV